MSNLAVSSPSTEDRVNLLIKMLQDESIPEALRLIRLENDLLLWKADILDAKHKAPVVQKHLFQEPDGDLLYAAPIARTQYT